MEKVESGIGMESGNENQERQVKPIHLVVKTE